MTPSYWLFGTQLRILISEKESDSRYDLIEGLFPARTETPLHLHTKYDKVLYVLEGSFTVYTDTRVVSLVPGEHIFVPRNTQHVIVASGETVNRALALTSPSGFGQLVRGVGIPGTNEHVPPATPNDMGLFIQLSGETGDVILGTPGARPVLKKINPS